MKKIIGIILSFGLLCLHTYAQNPFKDISFNNQKWTVSAAEYQVEKYQGQEALAIKNGIAILPEADFKNGIIEFDIAFAEKRQFSGVLFRMVDNINYEEFYLRPHQSGNPDANQYTPVFYANSGWQLYHGEGFGKPYQYKFDEWMHVKILVKDDQAEFYIDDMVNPLFRTIELKREIASGNIGFKSAREFTYYSNLTYTSSEDVQLKLPTIERPEIPENVIHEYQVSQILKEKSIDGKTRLSKSDISQLKWTAYQSDYDGTMNLSQIGRRSPEDNTIFVKLEIEADETAIREMNFGFSDRARVYCNGQLLFKGQNEFLSRDYRYLGTIGYFDSVYLPLQKGKNEILIAVSENFGGWGLRAKLE